MVRPVLALATATALTLAAVSGASAEAVIVKKRVVDTDFGRCVFVKKTVINDLGDRFTTFVKRCRSFD